MKKKIRVPGAEPKRFAFPFAAVPKGARVLIYGGGIVGKTYVQEIKRTEHCRLVALADKKTCMIELQGIKLIKPEEIPGEHYDYLFIALERQDLAVEVWRYLLNIGILKDKMRWIDPCRKNSKHCEIVVVLDKRASHV